MALPEPYEPLTGRELTILRLLAAGLSDAAIAAELVLSVGTVKWYNRQIYDKLDVRSRTQAVARAAELALLPSVPAQTASAPAADSGRLPAPVTSFVGRQRELATIERLLAENRLVTLTGPGGSGKTRLAIQVASRLQKTFPGRAAFVPLAALSDPELVARAIAQQLGVVETAERPLESALADALRHQSLLLVLDNFEHLLPAASLVAELLVKAPGLRVLATSREALHLYGEHEFRVMPLALPDPAQADLPGDNEAMALFAQRAQAVDPDFQLTPQNAGDVARICIQLDGLPLAIELATAQLKYFALPELRERLSDRLGTLTGGPRDIPLRQQTLRDTIAWSTNLLSPAEQALFASLSVFRGGATAELATQVSLQEGAAGLLHSLVDKSLLLQRRKAGHPARFWMLETVREYAAEQLQASGGTPQLRRRHAIAYRALAEQAELALRGGPALDGWLQRLEQEHDNIHAALDWSFASGDDETAARLAGALGYFWWRADHYLEGRRWTTLALARSRNLPDALRARVLTAAGRLAYALHERDEGKRLDEEALALYRRLGDRYHEGWSFLHLSSQSIGWLEEHDGAARLCEEGLAILRGLDDQPGIAQALNILGELARLQGNLERATDLYEECLAIARDVDDVMRQTMIHQNLGFISLRLGHARRAEESCRESLRLELKRKRDTSKQASSFVGLAGAAGALGDLQRAAQLLGVAEAFFEQTGTVPAPGDQPEYDRIVAELRQQEDEQTFDRWRAEGKGMTWDQAIQLAL
jgi:predicted ATPase/DNA-binding CsgD family transcriptional regulator